jgi:hypothetical protein
MFFLKLSADSKLLAEQVRNAKKKYPSLKVVGRGTVTVNPSSIVNSASFQEDSTRLANIPMKK